MKLQIPLWLLFCAAIFGVAWIVVGQFNTSRVTSDASLTPHGLPLPPNPSGIFVPPSDYIHIEFFTNTIPLVVRVEVSSNVWRRTVWYNLGRAQTNETLMASNLVSATTNSIP